MNWFMDPMKEAEEKHQRELDACFFIQERDKHIGTASIVAWGCSCPKCGEFFEFNTGLKWKFCPACGCAAKKEA